MAFVHDLDALRQQLKHPVGAVRLRAVQRWIDQHPRTDLVAFATAITDPDPRVVDAVAKHLAGAGDRWVPVLLRAAELERTRSVAGAEGDPSPLLAAAARTGHADVASPLISAFVRAIRERRPGGLKLGQALGHVRHAKVAEVLRAVVDALVADDLFAGAAVASLLAQGHRADMARVVTAWRRMDDWAPPGAGVTGALLQWLGTPTAIRRSLERAWRSPSPVDATLRVLRAALPATFVPDRAEPAQMLTRLADTCADILRHRNDRIGEWLREGDHHEPATDYRALAIAVDALTEALARPPSHPQDPGRQALELSVAAAAVTTLASRVDEASALEGLQAATRRATAWALFRRPTLATPSCVETVLTDGHKSNQAELVAVLEGDDDDVVVARACRMATRVLAPHADPHPVAYALARLADRAAPDVAAEAIPPLVALGDAATDALVSLLDDTPSDEVLAALGRLGTQAAHDALVTTWQAAVAVDLRVAEAIADIGHHEALDLLAPAWGPGLPPLAALLDGLAALHAPDDPRRVQWAADLADHAVEAVLHGTTAAET
ncbi:MAG: hypothetical protein RLZZ383_2280 [Pseudomonadota bacterium]|jgi:hypothetical protein